MTFKELLFACGKGELPEVKTSNPPNHTKFDSGKIVEIKSDGEYKGCGVRFPDLNYTSWYWAEDKGDRRSKYMSQLSLIKPETENPEMTASEKIDYLFSKINWKESFLDAKAIQIMNNLKQDITK